MAGGGDEGRELQKSAEIKEAGREVYRYFHESQGMLSSWEGEKIKRWWGRSRKGSDGRSNKYQWPHKQF